MPRGNSLFSGEMLLFGGVITLTARNVVLLIFLNRGGNMVAYRSLTYIGACLNPVTVGKYLS